MMMGVRDQKRNALECIKCLIHYSLLFHEVLNLEQVEKDLKDLVIDEEIGQSTDIVSQGEEFSWDSVIVDEVDSTAEEDTP
jgi:hypothetical protein